ncbi:MAG: M48 family metalloprotease [Proteobacteria bacterium]|nr:M48 family metalloprotease [Pseudomonadota bacterium]
MNFFESQDRARKHTFWLVLYFILAMVLIILALDLVGVGAVIYLNPNQYYIPSSQGYIFHKEAIIQLLIQCTLFVSPLVIMIILIGTIIRMVSLREGGIAVAKMVNAKEISPDTNDFLEKRFINVVEEMAIAAGARIPRLYVMEDTAINAFVAGIKPEDTVMVVTKGALQNLSRDELQGVVGHEFSHIFNGDMQISLKLMGILGGLLLLGQLGYFLLRIIGNTNSKTKSSSNNKSGGSIVIAILIVGVGLLVVGYVGLFFGRLIKAAVARQRELLADASSVQYTRNPQGIIFALRRIQQSEKGTYLATKNVEDISHLCFCTPRWILFQDLLATHPPLDRRIDLLDPQRQFTNLPLTNLKQENEKKGEKEEKKPPPNQENFIKGAAVAGAVLTPMAIENNIGNPTSDNIAAACQILTQIPDKLKDIAHSPEKVALLLYALILSYRDNIEDVAQTLSKAINKTEIQEVIDLSKLIVSLPKNFQLPLLDVAIPAFKTNSLDKRKNIYQHLKQLVSTKLKLFQFTLITLIGKATEDTLPKDNKVKYHDFQSVIDEISLLFSMLLRIQTKESAKTSLTYERLMKIFTDKKVAPPTDSITPSQFESALNTLNQLSPLCKGKLIRVLLDCISNDNIINLAEAELIRVIAASLDCPIAPIVANTDK